MQSPQRMGESFPEIAMKFDNVLRQIIRKVDAITPENQKSTLTSLRKGLAVLNDAILITRLSQPYLERYTYHIIKDNADETYASAEEFVTTFDLESNSDFAKLSQEHNYNKTQVLSLVKALRESFKRVSAAEKRDLLTHFLLLISLSSDFKAAEIEHEQQRRST